MSLEFKQNVAEVRVQGYLNSPQALTMGQIAAYDRQAASLMGAAEKMIANLVQYRIDLAQRYAELSITTAQKVVRLRRQKNYGNNKVFYFLDVFQEYPDGTTFDFETEEFPGTERNKAIAKYNEIMKSNPTAKGIQEIKRGRWE